MVSFKVIIAIALVGFVVGQASPDNTANEIAEKLTQLDPQQLLVLNQVIDGMTENKDIIDPIEVYKRDDKDDDKKDDKNDDKNDDKDDKEEDKGPTKVLDIAGIRVLIAFGGILVINMVAIAVHHIYLKLSLSEKSYRTIEHNLSPF